MIDTYRKGPSGTEIAQELMRHAEVLGEQQRLSDNNQRQQRKKHGEAFLRKKGIPGMTAT